MPSKTPRQQIRLSPELREKVRQLGELWAGVEGPLTPSAVFRVAVERAWLQHQQTKEKAWPGFKADRPTAKR